MPYQPDADGESAGHPAKEQARRRPGSGDPSQIQDLFLSRLDTIERTIGHELRRPSGGSGALQQFAGDFVREGWRVGRALVETVVRPHRLAARLAVALASRPTAQFGVDAHRAAMARDLVWPLARAWLRVRADLRDRLPAEGPALVLFNRTAWPLPADALVLWAVLAAHVHPRRDVYALWEPELLERPVVGRALESLGLFAATRENARILLESGAIVIGFPEGAAAREKTYDRRYRLARFEDRFLLSAAFESGARILPAAVVGSEESFPVLGSFVGVPLTPVFPLAGLLGLLPLPVRWSLRLGPAVEVAASPVASRSSAVEPHGLDDAVRARMQALLGELVSGRHSILTG
jgi:1-acyl-sn-glycerol-3-phosphate acyltransferase